VVEVEVKNQEIADFLSEILLADFRYTYTITTKIKRLYINKKRTKQTPKVRTT